MLTHIIRMYDLIHRVFDSKRIQQRLTLFFIIFFVISLLSIELNKFHMLPQWIAVWVPTNHFASIALVFTLILFIEVIGLVFTLAYSFSKALQMQLEILALILIRQSFKGLSTLEETFFLEFDTTVMFHIALPALTAIFIFICISIFKLLKEIPVLQVPEDIRKQYMQAKKIVSLGVFLGVMAIASYMPYKKYILHQTPYFFEAIYSLLIFADILIVLIAQYYAPSFLGMFRNSAYVVCTLFIRIALTSRLELMCAIGVFAGVYALLVGWFTYYFFVKEQENKCLGIPCRQYKEY